MKLLNRIIRKFTGIHTEILYLLNKEDVVFTNSRVAVQYRQGTVVDLESLEPERFEYNDQALDYSRRRLNAGDAFVIATLDNKIVAYYWVCFGQFQAGTDEFWSAPCDLACVYKVFTISELRGNGIYPASYRFLIPMAAERGIKRFTTSIADYNLSSSNSVKKIGYQEHGRIYNWKWRSQSFYQPNPRARRLFHPQQ